MVSKYVHKILTYKRPKFFKEYLTTGWIMITWWKYEMNIYIYICYRGDGYQGRWLSCRVTFLLLTLKYRHLNTKQRKKLFEYYSMTWYEYHIKQRISVRHWIHLMYNNLFTEDLLDTCSFSSSCLSSVINFLTLSSENFSMLQ